MTPIKPNQVRAFSNTQGGRSYYIVVQDGKGKLGAMWFRHKDGSPLHISWNFKIEETHDVIMEDCNKLRTVFNKMDEEFNDEDGTLKTVRLIGFELVSHGAYEDYKIQVIKAIRARTGLGLKEVKAITDNMEIAGDYAVDITLSSSDVHELTLALGVYGIAVSQR